MQSTLNDQVVDVVKAEKHRVFFVKAVVVVATSCLILNWLLVELEVEVVPVWILLLMVEVEVKILLFLKVEVEALGSPLRLENREKRSE